MAWRAIYNILGVAMLPLAGLYSRILQPFDLGFVALRNRVVMGAMHTGLEDAPRAAN
jgi:hypothetical protein